MYDPTKPYKEQILELIKQTWETPYVSVVGDVYPIIKKKFSYPEVDHTDGIGTKGVYHWQQRTFENAVIDALAMNLNDLALVGARPYRLQNHILLPEDDRDAILEIIETLAEECKRRDIAITGGETSIHNNIDGLEISLTVSGFIKNYKPNIFRPGDVLIGIRSNGLHSNGFTKVRDVFAGEYKDEFVEPTRIYLDDVLELEEQVDIHGKMHITGGAYTKLKNLLPDADANLFRDHKLQPQQIFNELYEKGITDEEMYKTFNCGIGFILSTDNAEEVISKLDADIIGEVVYGTGKIRIDSMFSDRKIEF